MGFIEHFINFRDIMDNHLNLLENKGRLLLMIPNKKGLRRLYGYLCDYDNLKKHNLKCMDKSIFIHLQRRTILKIIFNDYVGGFQYSVHQKINLPQRIIYRFVRFLHFYLITSLKNIHTGYIVHQLLPYLKRKIESHF